MQPPPRIEIHLATQRLKLLSNGEVIRDYAVSTARNGAGERLDSERTPRGRHVVAAKIGHAAVKDAIFVGRQATGEIYSSALAAQQPGRDWILTRILWLSGCEPGYNYGGDHDTYARYIYIHGTCDDTVLGVPGSRGCIRMRNNDVIDLFDRVTVGCAVDIAE